MRHSWRLVFFLIGVCGLLNSCAYQSVQEPAGKTDKAKAGDIWISPRLP